MRQPIVSRADATNPLWLHLRRHYEERLAELRAQNDAKGRGDIDTAFLRGQIAECKAFLGLADEPTYVEA